MIKKGLFLLIIIGALCLPLPNASAAVGLFKNGIIYYPSGASGIFKSNLDFYASLCEFSDGLILFEDFDMGSGVWTNIGFNCSPSNSIITLDQISSSKIKYNMYAPSGSSTSKIYLGSKGYPTTIYNAYKVEYDEVSKVLTLYVSHAGVQNIPIEIIFGSGSEVETETDILLKNSNILQAILLIWTSKLGTVVFPALIFFLLGAVLYINFQSFIPVVFFAALIFVLIRPIIPAGIFGFILVLIVVGVAIIFYWLFVRERK
jgi:hypothetical protein